MAMIEAIRGVSREEMKALNCWLLVVARRIHCWTMSSSTYTPGRATGRANSLLRMVPHAWLYSHLMDTSVDTSVNSDHKLVLTCTGAVRLFPTNAHICDVKYCQ